MKYPRLSLASAALLLICAVLLAYYPALDADFVDWDDRGYVLDNPAIHHLTPSALSWMLSGVKWAFWAPLTWLSYAVDYQLFAEQAQGYHLVNLLLHAANTLWVLVFIVFWPGTHTLHPWRKLLAAFCAALLFAWHPQHVEPVAWIASRKDLLSSFFFCAAVFSYLLYRQGRSVYFYGLALLTGLLAMLSKPVAMVLPVMLLVLDLYPLQRRISLLDKLPFFLLALLPGVMAVAGHREVIADLAQVGFWLRLQNAAEMSIGYVSKWFFPVLLSPYYPFPSSLDWLALSSKLAALGLITALAVYFAMRKQAWWLAAWLSFGLVILPSSGLISFNQTMAGADRFTYLATLPFYILLGGILSRRHGLWMIMVVLVAGIFFGLTRGQLPVWQNRVSLWAYVAVLHPQDYQVRLVLGEAYQHAGQGAQARQQFQQGIAIAPDCLGCYYFLARSYLAAGLLQEAIAPLDYSLTHVQADDPQRADIYRTGVWLYSQLGDHERVAEYTRRLAETLTAEEKAQTPP